MINTENISTTNEELRKRNEDMIDGIYKMEKKPWWKIARAVHARGIRGDCIILSAMSHSQNMLDNVL